LDPKNSSALRAAVLFSVCIITLVAEPLSAFSHGFAGDRFFPATLTTDDPFAASELSLPTVSEIRQPGQLPVKVFDTSTDISVLVLPRTALTIGDGYSIQKRLTSVRRSGLTPPSSTFYMSFLRTTNTRRLLLLA
jgi:hypothetical protein